MSAAEPTVTLEEVSAVRQRVVASSRLKSVAKPIDFMVTHSDSKILAA